MRWLNHRKKVSSEHWQSKAHSDYESLQTPSVTLPNNFPAPHAAPQGSVGGRLPARPQSLTKELNLPAPHKITREASKIAKPQMRREVMSTTSTVP